MITKLDLAVVPERDSKNRIDWVEALSGPGYWTAQSKKDRVKKDM